jgi:hypothetical protein
VPCEEVAEQLTVISQSVWRRGRRILVFAVLAVLVVSVLAGLELAGYRCGPRTTHFSTIVDTAAALEKDGRLVTAEKGLSYQFDSNYSGLIPMLETVNGVSTTVGNFVFYAYGNQIVSICGMMDSRNIVGEIEVRVPFTEAGGYDTSSIVVYHYSPPFFYACQVPPAPKIDASLLEFHVSVNYSGSWIGFYGYSQNSSASHVYKTQWQGKGPASITVIGEGDIYHGVFVCVGVQKGDGGSGEITLTLVSYSGDVTTNSTASGGLVTLCGGTSVIFPE